MDGRNTWPGVLLWYALDIVNASLVSADYLDAGVVTWACTRNPRRAHRELLSFVDVGLSPGAGENPRQPGSPAFAEGTPAWLLQHKAADRDFNRPQELRPFLEVRAVRTGKALYPRMDWRRCEVTLAAYAQPKGAPPAWFEVAFEYGADGGAGQPRVSATPTSRPRVGWRFLG